MIASQHRANRKEGEADGSKLESAGTAQTARLRLALSHTFDEETPTLDLGADVCPKTGDEIEVIAPNSDVGVAIDPLAALEKSIANRVHLALRHAPSTFGVAEASRKMVNGERAFNTVGILAKLNERASDADI